MRDRTLGNTAILEAPVARGNVSHGPGHNFDLQSWHVLPTLVREFHDARIAGRDEVVVWGSGSPRREFLHVDDLADACLFIMRQWDEDIHINVGTGEDLTIRDLAEVVREIVYPEARLAFDTSKPGGMPRKLLDVSRLHALGWRHHFGLRDGVASAYRWFLNHQMRFRGRSEDEAALT